MNARQDDDTIEDEPDEVATRFPGLRVRERIGAGGSGVIYRSWSELRQAWVALKVLRRGRFASDAQRTRFQREVTVLQSLEDPGVVQILDSGLSDDGAPWLMMELIEGPSLQQLLDDQALPPPHVWVSWLHQLAQTLARLHSRGVYHRDIKPSNILITAKGEPRLADFGVVMVSGTDRLTMDSHAVGTPRFMAPEQTAGAVSDWARVDLYALGLVMAELLQAHAPLPGDQRPFSPRANLRWIVSRATAAAPGARYESLTAFAADLESWRDGPKVRVRPTALLWDLEQWHPFQAPALWMTAVALLALGLAAMCVTQWTASQRAIRASVDWDLADDHLATLWSRGDRTGAEEWVRRFTSNPARLGTPATGNAWLALAALHLESGAADAHLASLGHAIGATSDATVRARAAGELAAAWRTSRRWEALERLLEANPSTVMLDLATRRSATLALALARGDLATAAGLLPSDQASLLAPFQHVQRFSKDIVGGLDSDGNGVLEWVDWKSGPGERESLVRDGDSWHLEGTLGGRSHAGWRGKGIFSSQHTLWATDATGATRLGFGTGRVAVLGSRLFLVERQQPRHLVELAGEGLRSAHARTDALLAFVTDLRAGDVDGDGIEELVVSLGPTFGYMVRIFRPGDAADPERLMPVAETRPGFVNQVAVLATPAGPRVLGVVTHENPSVSLFGATDPYGGPCRLMMWQVASGQMTLAQSLSWEAGTCRTGTLHIADLNGDGVDEVMINRSLGSDGILVLQQTSTGRLEQAFELEGYSVVQVVSADSDPADEVLLRGISPSGQNDISLLAGAGQETLPLRQFPRTEVEPSDDALVQLFQDLSLDREAAVSSEQIGDFRAAALLWERVGEHEKAALALRAAAEHDTWRDPDELERGIHLALMEPDAALASELVSWLRAVAPDRAARAAQKAETLTRPAWQADLARPLDPRLHVLVPTAVQPDLTRSELRVKAPSELGAVLRLPLRATGGPPWIRVAGSWVRSEWGSSVAVLLRPSPPVRQGVGLRLLATGAGGSLFREIWAVASGSDRSGALWADALADTVPERRPVSGDAVETTFDLRVGVVGDGTLASVSGTVDGMPVRRSAAYLGTPNSGDKWELVVVGESAWNADAGHLGELVIRKLEVGGVHVLRESAPALSPLAAWAFAEGPVPVWPLEGDTELSALVRLDPNLMDRVIRTWGERETGRAFNWESTPGTRAAESVQRDSGPGRGTLQLPSREAADWSGRSCAQGDSLYQLGRLEEARRALEVCLDVTSGDLSEWRLAFRAAQRMAELELSLGRESIARGWMERAVSQAPDEDLGRRLLRTTPGLAAVVGRPGWDVLGSAPPDDEDPDRSTRVP